MDIVQIIVQRISDLEENLLHEIRENRSSIGSIKESCSHRVLNCSKQFASKSYVRKAVLLVLILTVVTVTESELVVKLLSKLVGMFI